MTRTQTWIITGASKGLGLALTEAVLAAGHHVVATSRSGELPLQHDELTVLELDVTDAAACRAAVNAVIVDRGCVDVLVNNAGFGLVGSTEEVAESQARQILDVDLLGPLWLAQAALPAMRSQGSGHIVQVSSVGGVGAIPFFGLYNAAKWGLEAFSEALAGEAAPFGVRVTIAEVGAMDTEWATGSMQFAEPMAEYDQARTNILGTPTVPWETEPGATGGGTPPAEIARHLLKHIESSESGPLRLLLGDDAPAQVAAAMSQREQDYRRDARFVAAADGDTTQPDGAVTQPVGSSTDN